MFGNFHTSSVHVFGSGLILEHTIVVPQDASNTAVGMDIASGILFLIVLQPPRNIDASSSPTRCTLGFPDLELPREAKGLASSSLTYKTSAVILPFLLPLSSIRSTPGLIAPELPREEPCFGILVIAAQDFSSTSVALASTFFKSLHTCPGSFWAS